jgi:hypothetical protein
LRALRELCERQAAGAVGPGDESEAQAEPFDPPGRDVKTTPEVDRVLGGVEEARADAFRLLIIRDGSVRIGIPAEDLEVLDGFRRRSISNPRLRSSPICSLKSGVTGTVTLFLTMRKSAIVASTRPPASDDLIPVSN